MAPAQRCHAHRSRPVGVSSVNCSIIFRLTNAAATSPIAATPLHRNEKETSPSERRRSGTWLWPVSRNRNNAPCTLTTFAKFREFSEAGRRWQIALLATFERSSKNRPKMANCCEDGHDNLSRIVQRMRLSLDPQLRFTSQELTVTKDGIEPQRTPRDAEKIPLRVLCELCGYTFLFSTMICAEAIC